MLFPEPQWSSSDTLKLFSDAAGIGYAAVLGSHWFQGQWPPTWEPYPISVKELYPIVLAVQLWGDKILQNKKILFLTDNESVVFAINQSTSKNSATMRLIRSLTISTMLNNIQCKAKHIPGKTNFVADRLSRFQNTAAHTAAPWLDTSPTAIPQDLLPWME
jgi:hypothetical protein